MFDCFGVSPTESAVVKSSGFFSFKENKERRNYPEKLWMFGSINYICLHV